MQEAAALPLLPTPQRSLPWPAALLRTALLVCGAAIVGAACGPLQLPTDTDTAHVPAAGKPARTSAAPAGIATTPALPPPAKPRRIALLLPLSGAQAAAAEAIRDGFMAAYFAEPAGSGRPEILVFDEERPGPAAAYQAAIDAGADSIVGPLLKESVNAVAAIAGPVPLLTLNYLDTVDTAAGFHQFALAPEDEAASIAERAASQGQLRALALVPDSEWGRRMLTAFASAFEARGGTVAAYRLYDPAARDYTAQIQRLLLLDESRARQRQLVANLGVPLEFEPRRRGDVDCIFLAASPTGGRLIRPQLRFLYAGSLPTYATSAIYLPGTAGDIDLEGIMFTDAPALIGWDPRASALREALAQHWPPGAANWLRFHAMGYDAYTLVQKLRLDSGLGLQPINGLSGNLSADSFGRVHRQMAWAAFRNGQLVPLGEAPVVTSDDWAEAE